MFFLKLVSMLNATLKKSIDRKYIFGESMHPQIKDNEQFDKFFGKSMKRSYRGAYRSMIGKTWKLFVQTYKNEYKEQPTTRSEELSKNQKTNGFQMK